MTKAIKVGLGVIVVKNGKILLGTRKGSHCPGQRAVPGGHLEFGESLERAAYREVDEETGLKVELRRYNGVRSEWFVANNVLGDSQYIGIFMVADWISGEPENREKDKNEGWEWVDYDTLLGHAKQGCAWLPAEFLGPMRKAILWCS